jgi:hypothetical protein
MSKIIGKNERWYISETGAQVSVVTVLVEGTIGDYTAYSGIGSPEYVAQRGNKISFAEACIYFPFRLMKEKYKE